MKRKSMYLITFLILGSITSSFGQKTFIELSFTAKYAQEHVPLDSILIMNLTQGYDTVLYAPDTVLLVEYIPFGTMINHPRQVSNNFSVSPNYPNPFVGQTSVDVCIEKANNIVIHIFDLSGREHASYEGALDVGKHTFTFHPGKENFYIFSASYSGMIQSIKIVNPGSNHTDCKLEYKGFVKQASNLKSHTAGYFQIYENDLLRYIGYSKTISVWMVRGSDVIEDMPDNNETYIFDITEGVPCVNVPTISYNFQLYNTVQIGTQCWLKENLNVGTMIDGIQPQINNQIMEKYCYNDNPANCVTYGGLYQWDEAMNYATQLGSQGLCPQGWHIPSDEEFKQLEGFVDTQYGYPDPEWDTTDYRGYDVGKRLKSRDTWANIKGNNYFGFSALGTGGRRFDGAFLNINIYTSFWSSEWMGTAPWYRCTEHWIDEVARMSNTKLMGRGVRCLKDE